MVLPWYTISAVSSIQSESAPLDLNPCRLLEGDGPPEMRWRTLTEFGVGVGYNALAQKALLVIPELLSVCFIHVLYIL